MGKIDCIESSVRYDERTRCCRVPERRFKEFRLHRERRIPPTSKRMNRDEHFEPLRIRSM